MRGFTLVELLIALAIVSLITLMLFSGLQLGSRAWEGVDAVSERVSEVRLARDFLMTTLSQARPTTIVLEGSEELILAGDGESLEFAAPLSEQVGVPGLYILRLSLVPIGGEDALVLTRWLVHPEVIDGLAEVPTWEPLSSAGSLTSRPTSEDLDSASGAYGQTLLLDRVETFEIGYYGIADGGRTPDWHDEWIAQSSMPMLVRVRLATPEQSWPDLIVSLPARIFR